MRAADARQPDDTLAGAVEVLHDALTSADEPALLALIQRLGVSARAACARQLARVGTVAAVPALVELSRALLSPGELRAGSRAASGAIQERAGGAGRSQLSVVERGAGGGLSLEEGA